MKYWYRYRYLGVDAWEAASPWSQVKVVAASDEEAYSYFNICGADKNFYKLCRKEYNGKLPVGTKRKVAW